jgi:uncharacterized protein YjeT (DUF2065 family)
MTVNKITRIVYGLLGMLYVLIGVGSMLLPTGWLPQRLADDVLAGETPSSFVRHLLQEFGTVVLALGCVFLWYASRKEQSRSFHWAITFYFSLDALIHWVGPEGLIGSWQRGITNSIPLVVMLLLGVLQLMTSRRIQESPASGTP